MSACDDDDWSLSWASMKERMTNKKALALSGSCLHVTAPLALDGKETKHKIDHKALETRDLFCVDHSLYLSA